MVAREAGSLLWKLVGWVCLSVEGARGQKKMDCESMLGLRYLESLLSNVHNVGMRCVEPDCGSGRLGI